LEQKIDTLLTVMLRAQWLEAQRSAVSMEVDAAGITFESDEPWPVGETLELDITLSLYPFAEISCLAEVVSLDAVRPSADEHTSGYLVAARFVAISEADLDHIHRFILTTQRERRRAHPI
jgi:hypothetical protein